MLVKYYFKLVTIAAVTRVAALVSEMMNNWSSSPLGVDDDIIKACDKNQGFFFLPIL